MSTEETTKHKMSNGEKMALARAARGVEAVKRDRTLHTMGAIKRIISILERVPAEEQSKVLDTVAAMSGASKPSGGASA